MHSNTGLFLIRTVLLCAISWAWVQTSFAQSRPPYVSIDYSSYRIIGDVGDNDLHLMFVETHDPEMAIVLGSDSEVQSKSALSTKQLEKCFVDTRGMLDKMIVRMSTRAEPLRHEQSQGKKLAPEDAEVLRILPNLLTWQKGLTDQPRYVCALGRQAARWE